MMFKNNLKTYILSMLCALALVFPQFAKAQGLNQSIVAAGPYADTYYFTNTDFDLSPIIYASSGLPVIYSSNNPAVATIIGNKIHPVSVGSFVLTMSQPGNATYNAAPDLVVTITFVKGFQNIAFPEIPAKALSDADFDPGATSNGGLPITYVSSNTAVATIVAGKIHIVGLGTANITASQAGDANYNPAPSEIRLLSVSPNTQTITFAPINKTYLDPSFIPSATASSNLPISYYTSSNPAVATILNSTTIRIVGVGTSTITAFQNGSPVYQAASASTTLTVGRANQNIFLSSTATKAFNTADYDPLGSASSSLPVTYTSSNAAVATIVANKIHITGVGTTTITASQVGDGNYDPATDVTQSLTITKADQTITFPDIASKPLGVPDFDPGATVSSGLSPVYTSSNPAVATIVANKVHIVGLGSTTITAEQPGDANNNAAISVAKTLTVSGSAQIVSIPPILPKTVGDADFNPGASASSGLAITYSSSNTSVATIVSNLVHIVGAGTATITATQLGDANYAGASASTTLTVNKRAQTITFEPLPTKLRSDADFSPNASASSSLPITYSSSNPAVAIIVDNMVRFVGAGSTTITANQGGDATYNAATAVTQNLNVNRGVQLISFPIIPPKTPVDVDFDPGSTSNSGLQTVYTSSNPAVATIVGRLVHIVGLGSTVITSSQAGDANYEPASVSRTLIVSSLVQVIDFPVIASAAIGDADFDPGATVNSGLPITYTSSNPAVATIVANKIHIVGTGATSITASQPGNGVYAAAESRTRQLVVTKQIQTITFPIFPVKTIGEADFATGATINTPLPIIYTSSNPAVATVTGGIVHIVGTGTTTITAAQPGDGTYEAATSVSRTLTVNGNTAQIVLISPIADKPFNTPDFNPGAVSNSGLAIVYTSSNPAVATIVNNQIHIVGIGTTTITATQPGSVDYAAASASTTMNVIKGTPTIFFPGIPLKTVNNPDFDLFASTTAGLPITYSSNNLAVATIVNGKVHLVGVGTAIITASQPGNANYNPSSADQTLTVDKGVQFITFPAIPQTSPSTADFDPGATASSGLPITYTSSDLSVATIVAGKIRVIGLGTATITASQPGNVNYNAATDVVRTITIGKAFQSITFPSITAKLLGTADFDPGATTSSGLIITYTSSDPTVATIVAGKIHIVGLGSTTITASQGGDVNFNAANSVSRMLNISANSQVITFAPSISKVYGSPDFTPEATASSGQEILFTSSNPVVASIVENRVRINRVGTAIITATQEGSTSFAGATAVSTLTVTKADQAITFPPIPEKQRNDPNFEIGASASSGLTVFYTSSNPAVATLIGSRVQITGMGTAVITATQPGDVNFNPAQNVTQTVTVVKGIQTITFPDLPVKALADVDFDPGATVNTGFPITYVSSNTAVATIVAGKIHVVGLGNTTITASVAGNADYAAALNVSKVLTVRGLSQTMTFNSIPNKKPSDADFDPGATVNTGLPIVYTSSDPSVATIIANKVHIVGVGTTTITATQAGDGTYASATASVTLTVSKATQTITFAALANKRVGDADFDPGATASSGLSIVYTSSDASVATIVANKVHIVGIGTTTITATQAGTTDIESASASNTLTVDLMGQTITFPAITAKDITTADFDPLATASSGLAVSYSSSNTGVATIVAGKVHIVGAGTSTITATQAGNATFGAATPVSVQLTVNKANQTITFPAITLKAPTDVDFDPLATASSGLAVSYSSSNPAVATIVAGKVHIVGSGTSVITASQAGNSNYNAATNVSQTLDVVYSLPVSNFNVKATDETCKTSNNGAINIQAVQALTYTAAVTVNGGTTTYPFSTVLNITNLQAGSYNVCITVAGQPNYKQCFDLVIKEPKDLAVYSSIRDNGNAVLLQLEGSTSYRIDVNGQIITTTQQEILVPLVKGNNIVKISSDLNCQGVITKTFLTSNVISLYPNPVKNVLNITTGTNESNNVKVDIHALDGRLVHTSLQRAEYGQVSVDLSKLNKGLYVLTLTVGNSKTVHKIIKD
ncbi:MAG: T9SS type A sorting domain-containing protein [Sphingobacteriales bacterium]|nr:MAG: T9SS type A sorting domain-containing protein [Sphingobacteriales bacterium]